MHRQNGNILFYILIAVALLGALSYVMARGSGDSAAGMSATRISEDVKSQAQTIRSAILECNLVNGQGYPDQPANPYAVADVECKDNTAGPYPKLFSGNSGRFLPQPPAPFTGWVYRKDDPDAGDIYIELSVLTDCSANQGLRSALSILDTQYTADEVTITCDGTTAAFRLNIVDM